MRVVFDTNVILTAAFDLTSVPSLLVYERDRLHFLAPRAGWAEARRVAVDAALRTGVDPQLATTILDMFRQAARIELVESRTLEGMTARGFDAQFEAVAVWEGADAICTYNGKDFRHSSTEVLTPLSLLRKIDFPKYAISAPTLDRADGCFLADFRWRAVNGRSEAWLLRDSGGRRFGVDEDGNWIWSDNAHINQLQRLERSVSTKLLVAWRREGLTVFSATGSQGFREVAVSRVTLDPPVVVEFIFEPQSGWQIELFSSSGAAVFPTKGMRKTILREGVVDSVFSSRSIDDLVVGTFALEAADGLVYLKLTNEGHRRPRFGHAPSGNADPNLLQFMWVDLVPSVEQLEFIDHQANERFTKVNGRWLRVLT